jgi:lauroyl/myristoyl acyltransferase
VRRRINLVRKSAAELARGLIMLLILRPAAAWLPRSLARGLAQLVGFLIALSPTRGRSTCSIMRGAFGLSKTQAFWVSQQWLARPFLDFVVCRRIINGREDWTRWKVEEIGSKLAMQIKNSDRSFILATGHFARESYLHLLLPTVVRHRVGQTLAPIPPRSPNPFIFRVRLQFGQMLDAVRRIRPDDVDFLFTGTSLLAMRDRLREPRNVVLISVDAYWTGGGAYLGKEIDPASMRGSAARHYCRAFAGLETYRFATGAASISRFAQCPILPCSMFMRSDRTVVIEWGEPISPPARKDQDADIRVMDQILDFIQSAVGCRPTQYVSEFGGSRRWNASKSQWEKHERIANVQGAVGRENASGGGQNGSTENVLPNQVSPGDGVS